LSAVWASRRPAGVTTKVATHDLRFFLWSSVVPAFLFAPIGAIFNHGLYLR